MSSSSCALNTQDKLALLRQAIGQKIMLDIRYFSSDTNAVTCHNNVLVGYGSTHTTPPKQGVTKLPTQVAALLSECNIGGVILFSENLVCTQQIKQLTRDLQQAGAASDSGLAMLISVDQEGGRVARLPRDTWPAFTGNMSIAASCHSNQYAYQIGKAIGQQLNHLGINVNHSPTVDVNINHNNPVINVRSFGDDPGKVAALGVEMGRGLAAANVIATYKHFPGHGDTNVDSHTGLPMVDHPIEQIYDCDLYPFIHAINGQCIDMVMTAHIQYPALDNSTLISDCNRTIIRPATLSRAIITTLLREQLHFNGVVITDALDMASISEFFSPLQVLLETFKAGADIALMPYKIHTPAGLNAFRQIFEQLVTTIAMDDQLCDEVLQSYARIKRLKKPLLANTDTSIDLLAQRALEQQLSVESIALLHRRDNYDFAKAKDIVIICPQIAQAYALKLSIARLTQHNTASIKCYALTDLNHSTMDCQQDGLLILAIEDKQSVVTLGGMDDQHVDTNATEQCQRHGLLTLMANVKQQGGGAVFVALKPPYHLAPYIEQSSLALVSFDGSVYSDDTGNFCGPAFDGLAQIIVDPSLASATLPININS